MVETASPPVVRLLLVTKGYGSKVFVDDIEVRSIRSVQVNVNPGDVATVTIKMFANVEIDGDVQVEIDGKMTTDASRSIPVEWR